MKKIYKFYSDHGRMGCLYGIFAEDSENVVQILGEKIYFGEVLGEHSEINSVITEKNLTVLSEDQDLINKCEEIGLIPMGHNPFDYWEDEE